MRGRRETRERERKKREREQTKKGETRRRENGEKGRDKRERRKGGEEGEERGWEGMGGEERGGGGIVWVNGISCQAINRDSICVVRLSMVDHPHKALVFFS